MLRRPFDVGKQSRLTRTGRSDNRNNLRRVQYKVGKIFRRTGFIRAGEYGKTAHTPHIISIQEAFHLDNVFKERRRKRFSIKRALFALLFGKVL